MDEFVLLFEILVAEGGVVRHISAYVTWKVEAKL